MLALVWALLGEISSGEIAPCGWPLDGECVARALAADGAVAITSVPGLATARANAFAELARCAGEQPQSLREFEMADGTIRRTAAARTHGGVAESLLSDCAPLHAAVDPLRVLVDQASRRFLRVLEPLEDADLDAVAAALADAHAALHARVDALGGADLLAHMSTSTMRIIWGVDGMIDVLITMGRSILADDAAVLRAGFGAADAYNYEDWLLRHGCLRASLTNPMVVAGHDLIFGYAKATRRCLHARRA